MALQPVPVRQVARVGAGTGLLAGANYAYNRISDYFPARRPLSDFLDERPAQRRRFNEPQRQRPGPSHSTRSLPSTYRGGMPRRWLTHPSWRNARIVARQYLRRRYGRVGLRRSFRSRRLLRRRPGRAYRRRTRRYRRFRKGSRRSSYGFYKKVIKCSVKRKQYTVTHGNEDRLTPITGATYRQCLLFQPHDVSGTVAANTFQNNAVRATSVPFYPLDYGTMETVLTDYTASLGNVAQQWNQRYLIDCVGNYSFTSMSNTPFVVDVVRWYCPRGIPTTVLDATATAGVLTSYNIINLIGQSAGERYSGITSDATGIPLYNCETVDTLVSNRNRYLKQHHVRFRRRKFSIEPGTTIRNSIRIKEHLFNIGRWWNNTGVIYNNVNARMWFIPPGSRGLFYIVRMGDAGVQLVADTSSVSHHSNTSMTYTTPAFSHHYQMKIGIRHIPETQKADAFITSTGITAPTTTTGLVENDETDAKQTQGNALD